MSLKLLIDEDTLAKPLVNSLRKAGHDVITVNEAGLSGTIDPLVLDYARRTERVLLTYNGKDFVALHTANSSHPGIVAIYRDSNRFKNMSRREIVKAIANLEAAQIPLAGQFVNLNQWNY